MSIGLDGHLCGFLGIEFAALSERVKQGGTDEESVAQAKLRASHALQATHRAGPFSRWRKS